MSRIDNRTPLIYNPSEQTAEEIVSNFVVRKREFEELFTAIKNDRMEKPPQHYLIQGQRGYGKTTLLVRLNLEIEKEAELNERIIPIKFDEEQYGVHTLARLWEEVIDILEDQYESFAGLSDKMDSLYDLDNPEEKIFDFLISELKKQDKKLVLLIDNFGDIIEKFSKKENQRFREVLITCSHIRIIGASSTVLEFYYNYKEPFFDFFKIIPLRELNRDETTLLLKKLGETYKSEEINTILDEQPERVEALRRLTGGVPRTIVLLFEIFLDDMNGNSFKDLEKILDRVTPLYKHRLDNLSTQQQLIIDAIAQNWDAVSTKDIAKKIRMPGKAVSAQLAQLEKNQLVKKISTSTKNFLYQINERFFNIYYLMRQGKRRNRNKVLWLVKFFEIWCGESELVTRTQRHIEAMRRGKLYDKHAFYITQALSKQKISFELQHELLGETKKYLIIKKSEYGKELDKSHLEVYEEVIVDVQKAHYESAKKKLIRDGANSQDIGFIIGHILSEVKKDYQAAIHFYSESIKLNHPGAMQNLAVLYQTKFKDYSKAELYYLMAIEKGNSNAICLLGSLYNDEFKDFRKAEQYYLKAADNGDTLAMLNLGFLYQTEFKDFPKAEQYYLKAIDNGDTLAMLSLGFLYETEFKDFRKAEQYYLMAIEESYSKAMYFLGSLYESESEIKDLQKAEKYYLMAVKKNDIAAMRDLAWMYFKLKRNKKKSLDLIQKAYDADNEKLNASSCILILLWNNEIEKAMEIYKKIFDRDEAQKEVNKIIHLILLMFISKRQYHFVYDIFKENKHDIKDKYKPVYYALLSLMGEEYADEFKKMGGELWETVEEIIKEINRLSVDYA